MFEVRSRPFDEGGSRLYAEYCALEQRIENEEDRMLLKLMAIRRGLWT
jgi:hypothetical protein